MKRYAVVLLLCLAASLLALPLLRELPAAPVRLGSGGQSWLCRPAVDSQGGLVVPWRYITGYREGGLIESLLLQRVTPSGVPAWRPAARLVWQGPFALVDHHSLPGDGAAAVVPDHAGGAYYLFGPWVLRLDSGGRNRWAGGVYPSRVRVTTDSKENIGALRLFADGTGGALAVWRSSLGVRAQRLDAAGSPLWGAGAVNLYFGREDRDRMYGRAVPDGRGGLVAFLMSNSYHEDRKPRVVFISGTGRAVRQTAPLSLGITLVNDSVYRIAADTRGGVYILYSRFTKTGPPLAGYTYRRFRQVRMARVDRAGRLVFDRALSGSADIVPERLLLRATGEGAVASWHHLVPAADPDDGDDVVHLRAVCLGPDGGLSAAGGGEVRFKAEVGLNKWKPADGARDILLHGKTVWLARESMAPSASGSGYRNTIYLHRVGVDTGTGRRIGEGHAPYLFVQRGTPGLLYHTTRVVGGVAGTVVPVLAAVK